MSLPRFVLVLVFLAAGSASARAEFSMFRRIWGDVVVSTDTTEAGRALQPASPSQPVTYKGMSLGRRLGSIVGDDEPSNAELNQIVATILAKQGYHGVRPGDPEPPLFIVIQWGYLRPGQDDLHWFLGYKASDDIGARSHPRMIGPEVFRQGMRSYGIQTILDDAKDPIYGVIVTAFEYKSARTPKPVIYWQTRIGLPANGKSMREALPVMIAAAGPAIGRPADKPQFLDVDRVRSGRVGLGEIKFLEYVEPTPRRTN